MKQYSVIHILIAKYNNIIILVIAKMLKLHLHRKLNEKLVGKLCFNVFFSTDIKVKEQSLENLMK